VIRYYCCYHCTHLTTEIRANSHTLPCGVRWHPCEGKEVVT